MKRRWRATKDGVYEERLGIVGVLLDVSMMYEFDTQAFVLDLLRGFREHEDEVGEKVLVDWLRSRGWTVEK